MKLVERFWTAVTYALSLSSFPSFHEYGIQQKPLFGDIPSSLIRPARHGPIFYPPGRRPRGDGSEFMCKYANMGAERTNCSTPEDRSCWLKSEKTGRRFDINTDYEILAPEGVLCQYTYTCSGRWFM
ncbi:uncharacterized protein LY89DRAFT_746907 [Mollisia scopiformis]|uniref:Uncharacterized protein n=1 Tax=Mollisia scopiformis TaxID=149040 RepID=A0A194XB19_MOLSC|nr:uncharacterized protein LY89DRAFT_746907 [Mollisia scopiformis]KUJ17363.1 hypothetical protein LY89DRAFT_746907 [Mollisia scopiformis]